MNGSFVVKCIGYEVENLVDVPNEKDTVLISGKFILEEGAAFIVVCTVQVIAKIPLRLPLVVISGNINHGRVDINEYYNGNKKFSMIYEFPENKRWETLKNVMKEGSSVILVGYMSRNFVVNVLECSFVSNKRSNQEIPSAMDIDEDEDIVCTEDPKIMKTQVEMVTPPPSNRKKRKAD